MGFNTPLKANVYRVYSDPKGADQKLVIAHTSDQAIAACNLSTPRAAQCYFMRRATIKDYGRPSLVVADSVTKR